MRAAILSPSGSSPSQLGQLGQIHSINKSTSPPHFLPLYSYFFPFSPLNIFVHLDSFLTNESRVEAIHHYCRRTCVWHNAREEHFGHIKRTVWREPNDTDFKFYDHGSQHKIEQVTDEGHNPDALHLSALSLHMKDGIKDVTTISTSNGLTLHLLKSAFLFGLFTLHGTEQAYAASDFVSSFQLTSFFGDLGDISTGFASAFLLIFFSELGDKTFFIAALLAARNSAAVVFTGTFGALALMTIISVILGRTFHYIDGILPFSFGGNDLPIDDIAAVVLLVYFGVTTLVDATSADSQTAEDEQKEAELAVSEFSGNGAGILAAASTVISTFALVFVAEWGDKSFFSTIALAAASSPLGVIGGALAGHGVATLLAVAGGSLLGSFLSEKVIAYTGGILFLMFAGITLVEIIRG